MAKPPTNVAASVRGRLLNLARQTNQPFDVLLHLQPLMLLEEPHQTALGARELFGIEEGQMNC
jgi:hypothetical protein